MQYRYLGKSGLQVSELALGSWLTYGKVVGNDTAEACIAVLMNTALIFLIPPMLMNKARPNAYLEKRCRSIDAQVTLSQRKYSSQWVKG